MKEPTEAIDADFHPIDPPLKEYHRKPLLTSFVQAEARQLAGSWPRYLNMSAGNKIVVLACRRKQGSLLLQSRTAGIL